MSYISALFFDCIILVCTIIGLYRERAAQTYVLWIKIYRQGLIYFVVTCLVNVPLLVSVYIRKGSYAILTESTR